MLPSFLADRFIPELRGFPGLTPKAARAYWKALHLLGLGFARRLTELRSDPEPLTRAHGEVEELSLVISTLWEVIDLLRDRMERLPDKHRPQHTPRGRFRALRAGRVLKLSSAELAWLVSVSEGTVKRWQSEMGRADDDTRTIGKTVRPTPPLRRYADVVEHLCQALAFAGHLRPAHDRLDPGPRRVRRLPVHRSATVEEGSRPSLPSPPLLVAQSPASCPERSRPSGPTTCGWPTSRSSEASSASRPSTSPSSSTCSLACPSWPRSMPRPRRAPTSPALFRSAVKGLGAPVHFITDQGAAVHGEGVHAGAPPEGRPSPLRRRRLPRVHRHHRALLAHGEDAPRLALLEAPARGGSGATPGRRAPLLLRPPTPQLASRCDADGGLHRRQAGVPVSRPATARHRPRRAHSRGLPHPPPRPRAAAAGPRPRGVAPDASSHRGHLTAHEPHTGLRATCASVPLCGAPRPRRPSSHAHLAPEIARRTSASGARTAAASAIGPGQLALRTPKPRAVRAPGWRAATEATSRRLNLGAQVVRVIRARLRRPGLRSGPVLG